MTCEEALILISGHLDGENTPEEEAMLQEHLARCADCRRILEAYTAADAGLLDLSEDPPEELHQRIMDAVAAEPKLVSRRRRFRPAALGLAAAAALALALGLNYLPQQQEDVTDQPVAVQANNALADALPSDDTAPHTALREAPGAASPSTFSVEPAAEEPEATDEPDAVSSLLVELGDNPASPAVETIAALKDQTAHIDNACGTYSFDLTASVVRQIIADYSEVYAFRTHGDLEGAADDAVCQLIIVCG